MINRRLLLAFLAPALLPGQWLGFNNPVISPSFPAFCGTTPYNITQNDYQPYTLYCTQSVGSVAVGAGSVNATGYGGCPGSGPTGLQNFCQASILPGGNAPQFGPHSIVSGAYFVVSINVDSHPLNAAQTSCDGESYSSSPTPSQLVQRPVCPVPKPPSPIVVDVTGEGFFLTDNAHGVQFREQSGGPLMQLSWTDPAHHNAWLVRPNADGSVTSLADNFFGDLSPQPVSAMQNGYSALSYWMQQVGCGKLTRLDSANCPAVWSKLRLWQDANQDGVAQPEELHGLADLGVYALSLTFHASRQVDQYGNQFRYEGHIWDATGADHDNRTYDVFLLLN